VSCWRTPAGSTHPEAFAILSKAWLRIGRDVKHVYRFTWLGRPIIHLPEDIVRVQEVIYRTKADVVIETASRTANR
jgi:cephalosporin hydroxylase